MYSDGDPDESAAPSFLEGVRASLKRKWQQYVDSTVIYPRGRWAGFGGLIFLYALRVWFAQGWYIVTYGLAIYLLNLFLGFLSPAQDPELDGAAGPLLPVKDGEHMFIRRVPEFKFWLSAVKATVFSLFLTFFRIFDVPVFWPILLIYFFALFFLTMKRQIKHMIKHGYVPWSFGKQRFTGKKDPLNHPGESKPRGTAL